MVSRALVLGLLFFSSSAFGAACCGGGTGSSALIFSDHRARLLSSYENIAYVYDVNPEGDSVKRSRDEQEVVEKINLAATYMSDDFWQSAVSISVNKVTRKSQNIEESSTLLGDTTITFGYEFLPEMYYSKWKPRGFVYNSVSIPTGKSKYETIKMIQTDVSGSGLYSNKVGISFFKLSGSFDLMFDININFYQSSTVDSKDVSRKPSTTSLVAIGYSPRMGNLRFGVGGSYLYDGSTTVNQIKTPSSKLMSLNLASSYMINDYTGTIVYKDDTFFSKNKNTTLSRSFLLSFSKSLAL